MVTNSSGLLKWVNVVAFISTVIVNGLAGSTTLLGGRNTAEISDLNPTLITPAGFVFSIWGVIYILLGVFTVYQALPNQQGKAFKNKIGWLFFLGSILNIIWLFLWQFEHLLLSNIIMFLLLATLILIYLRLGIGKSKTQLVEKLSVNLPFSVYLGWITIASIANVAVTLVSINWDRFGISADIWGVLILIVALAVTLLVTTTRKDVAYGLVVIWALTGIAVKQSGNETIILTSEICAIIIAISLVVTLLLSKLRRS